ncbi:MAG: sodium:proton antiporter [Phycisphaerales bacterium]
MSHDDQRGFNGPKLWAIVVVIASLLGAGLGFVTPVRMHPPTNVHVEHIDPHPGVLGADPAKARHVDTDPTPGPLISSPDTDDHADAPHLAPEIPLWLLAPFATLLLSIALLPFLATRFWNRHYPAVAFALGAFVLGYYLCAYGEYGRHQMVHSGLEYFQFIALVGSLFVATGGVVLRVNPRGAPIVNAALLFSGAVLANFIGTAGASILLIRPFIRINRGRLRPLHVIFFIFIVSNCGGSLTPIGDPPLYLGFLKGVPFFWTLAHLWQEWAVCIGMLVAMFFAVDTIFLRADRAREARDPAFAERIRHHPSSHSPPVLVSGALGMACLALVVLAVFVDPLLKDAGVDTHGVPVAPFLQLAFAIVAYKGARSEHHEENQFNFHPVQEVGYLFAGIFITMAPALGYLAIHGPSIGLATPTHFYFATGSLSAVLDNAPTYLNFLQTGLPAEGYTLTPGGVHSFIDGAVAIQLGGETVVVPGSLMLAAISLGAVFFGAATYIGNAPNFMVKAIAEAEGVRMPGFIGYLRYSVLILLPVLVVIWALFLRL